MKINRPFISHSPHSLPKLIVLSLLLALLSLSHSLHIHAVLQDPKEYNQ